LEIGKLIYTSIDQVAVMQHNKYRLALIVISILSIIVGAIILAFDGLLWFDNPVNGHAYALVIFVIIQAVVLGVFVNRAMLGVKLMLAWSIIYLILLLLNPLTGPVIGIPPDRFAAYLVGIAPFAGSPEISCPFTCPPFIITYDLLIIFQVLIIALAWRSWR